jgi:hypothetical protein
MHFHVYTSLHPTVAAACYLCLMGTVCECDFKASEPMIVVFKNMWQKFEIFVLKMSQVFKNLLY